MTVKTSKFPTENWDGITANHPSREDDIDPNFDDYDQLVAEMIATQVHVAGLGGGSGDLLADGTIPLTANWDVGTFSITALQFESDIVTGTAPLIVASTTVVANLNVDQVDGIEGTEFIQRDGSVIFTGKEEFKSVFQQWTDATDGATITFDLDLSNKQRVTLGGNRILALSNDDGAQSFTLRLKQDGTGTRTVTWFAGISWAGGAEPTLTTTANKADSFVFIRTGAATYDGFILGQDI